MLFCLIPTIACLGTSLAGPTVDIGDASEIQFRFVQEEHAGGYCNCWDIDDLTLVVGPNSAILRYAIMS